MRNVLVVLALAGTVVVAQQPATPRQQPGAAITMFAPEQHDLYDGHYILSASRIHMVGGLNDPAGWDHMDNAAKAVKPVAGTAEIDVNDITNTGTEAVDGWTLGFTFPRPWESFGSGWNGTWTADGATVSATNVDWNAGIAPGATINVGYVGNYAGPNVLPTVFTLNGTVCTTT